MLCDQQGTGARRPSGGSNRHGGIAAMDASGSQVSRQAGVSRTAGADPHPSISGSSRNASVSSTSLKHSAQRWPWSPRVTSTGGWISPNAIVLFSACSRLDLTIERPVATGAPVGGLTSKNLRWIDSEAAGSCNYRLVSDYLNVNLANWNSRVRHHANSYPLDRFRADPSYLSDVVRFDLPRLGDIRGLDVVHLQCHIGTDTLSLAKTRRPTGDRCRLLPTGLGRGRWPGRRLLDRGRFRRE